MLDQIMESRRGEQMALLRNIELTTMMLNRGTADGAAAGRSDDPAAAGRSDDPALNRAGGGPRREGYVAGLVSKDEISPEALRVAQGILITQSLAPGTHRTYGSHER